MVERKFVIADPQKCNGCGVCELVCSGSKDKAFNRRMSRIKMVNIEPTVDMALACRLCEDAPCVRSCARKALRQDEETGVILVDENKCNGCGWCIEACDFGAIALNPAEKVVEICDLCQDQEEPQCVKFCLKEALSLSTPEVVAQKARREVVAKLLEELLAS